MYASIRPPHSIMKNFNFCLLLVENANEGLKWFQGFIFNKLMHPLRCHNVCHNVSQSPFSRRHTLHQAVPFPAGLHLGMHFITNWWGKIAQRLNHIVSGIFIMYCCNTAGFGE